MIDENELAKKWDLEQDLVNSECISEKCRDKVYAQNLYAAMCNTSWLKNEIWPQLSDYRWSCSWRYAGGIIADIRGEGGYLDWYCSGIYNASEEAQSSAGRKHVPEGVVTDEIKEDLFRLGWILMDDD